ncbi:MAG: acyltransferase family protein [Clostridia bacterium]|nr:acyltransferase family protein [Clostridia bacterium]
MVAVKETENIIMNSKRYDYLDVAKGLGILLVVIAHINYTPPLLTTIYSFHMPLFFFLSGMVFNRSRYTNFRSFIKRKLQTLICPYILFYVLSILYRFCVDFLSDSQNIDWGKFLNLFLQMFLSQGSGNLPNAPLWFVPCLFAVELAYFGISKLKNWLIICVSVLLTGFGWFLESDLIAFENNLLPWSLDSALFAVGFFALGNLMFNTICKAAEKAKTNRSHLAGCISVFLLAVIMLVPLALYNGKVTMGSKVLNNGFIFYLTGLLGVCAILALSILFEKNGFLKYCGRNSFQIMAVHYLIRDFIILCCLYFDIPLYDKTNLIQTILPIIINICLSLLCVALYNKVKLLLKTVR